MRHPELVEESVQLQRGRGHHETRNMKRLGFGVTVFVAGVAVVLLLVMGFYYLNPVSLASHQRIDFYGKVVDQNDQAVSGVTVTGSVMSARMPMQMNPDWIHVTTTTDDSGLFRFEGLSGASLAIWPQKDGYQFNFLHDEFNYSGMSPESERYKPDANRLEVFKLWKLKGFQGLKNFGFNPCIPGNGSAFRFDLMAGRFVREGGDLIITFTRNPSDIQGVGKYDWTATLSIPSGGLIPYDIREIGYANEAPQGGYQTDIQIGMLRDDLHWTNFYTKTYFFKTGRGCYGRLSLELNAGFQDPPGGYFGIGGYINPSGSTNLEKASEEPLNTPEAIRNAKSLASPP
jgi:hypothetical protein